MRHFDVRRFIAVGGNRMDRRSTLDALLRCPPFHRDGHAVLDVRRCMATLRDVLDVRRCIGPRREGLD
jgi:hypothetical protein